MMNEKRKVMQLERNRYNPSMMLVYSIARIFEVTIEDLFEFMEISQETDTERS